MSFVRKSKMIFFSTVAKLIMKTNIKNIRIASFIVFSPKGQSAIGKDFFAGESFYLSTNIYCNLSIGDSVMFGPRVSILGGNHDYKFTDNHLRYNYRDDQNTGHITIENGAWVGANTTILSGANISEGSIVGAGGLVSHYIPPYVIAVGTPAKIYKARFNKHDLSEILINVNSNYRVDDIFEIYSKFSVNLVEG